MDEVVIAHEPEQRRYTITVGGAAAGMAQYRQAPGTLVFTHTEIAPTMGGRGLGSRLIAFALDDARTRGLAVVPLCSFVREYIERHPQRAALVPEAQRVRFGL